jgi:hypothetical protein
VLIDSTHKKWIVVTAVIGAAAFVVYRVWHRHITGGWTGGSFIGLWYGISGAALMLYAGLLSAHRLFPSAKRLGPRQTWLRGHIWLGLLSVLLVLCHSGFRWGGTLEVLLWWVLIGVIGTGILGVILQQVLPRLLTARVGCEAPYEQIPHVCEVMRRQADTLVDTACGPYDPSPQALENTIAVMQYASNARAQLRDFYEAVVRPFLAAKVPPRSPLLDPLQAAAYFSKLRKLSGLTEVEGEVDQLARLCEERRLLREQERLHFLLHVWLLVHVPLSAALLVLGAAHIVTALYF